MTRLQGLRPRITLLVTSVVAVCLLAGFLAVYRGTSARLQRTTDQGLREDVSALRAAVTGDTSAAISASARTFIQRQAVRPTTHVVFVVPPAGRAIVTNEPELLDTSGHDPDDTPAERRTEAADARSVLGAPTGFTRRRLPGVGTVRLLLGGLLVASRIAAPLRRMARVAGRVDAGELSPRMALGGRPDEVRILARSFDQMLDRLQDAFARQSTFVADASHELRTPLTIVRGQLEVLAMSEHPRASEVRHVERVALREIDRMSRLVEDLLLLAHADDEAFLRAEPIDLPELLADLCASQRPSANRRLVLEPVPPIVLDADPDRLVQALRNLVANAIAHTRPGGLVRVTARTADGDAIELIVDDDGPGVPPEDRARVFDRFARLDAERARDRGGAGLGLAIVRAIAEAHDGDVRVERAPEGGARFILRLPRQRA